MNKCEQYLELYKYFKGLYFSKKWFASFQNRKDEEFVSALFHEVLFSRMSACETSFDIIVKDFLINPEKFSKKEERNSYIAKVFKSRINDLLRKRNGGPRQFTEKEEQEFPDTSLNIYPEQIVIEENLEKISEDIKKFFFKPEICNLLALYYRKNLTYAKIAEATGRSTSGIGDAMKRIHITLGKILEEKMPIPPWLMNNRQTVLGTLLDYAETELLKNGEQI
ncbi:MAG TPA: hypothetical protein PLB16_06925 [bacterium]|nr:hypothetical protein [bacterium]